ncbi:hypothetical protein A2230_07000 [candidate division WOR-1 bacterium RIFOXYA2_FULL_36_21]|uniref:Glycosyltransferase 2-like domain-containing protein n=1 Tax=candidate division WOR-1 bacterium RIFOXYB2_FULL_36_35 TaxID=1802578 RepID=A0A1F4S2Z6_UNCSA|nr:MAG: hypothetical protein A2230_07000 [candidate division WOR-1 bacterium RIFOXYA2_FULL_36_21]OGC14825.1 MAG: hypothetical protein A2290_00825 [candidate division WOR-1 bacterium RIFOXYB2_FULL_36_35]OGC15577.1 MAG: hypothetical protein A2282_09070 [candidate division WOR-1 bacterium RIFOXYA12_FULL_36_13]
MQHKPYLILVGDYFHGSAGVKVLHRLCHLLNEKGEKAYIYGDKKTNLNWQCPTISVSQGKKLIEEGAIVIYPEAEQGNPLFAKNIVRYILNKPGLIGGDKTYPDSELLFAYVKQLLQPGMTQERVLYIPVIDREIFYSTGKEKRDIDYLVYVGRKDKIKGYSEKFKIYRHKPAKQEELGNLFRRCKKLISYDNFSVTIFEATLCGCPVVIIPDGSRTREDIENQEIGFAGMAWGDSNEEFEKAQKTVHKSEENLSSIEKEIGPAIYNFIKISQEYARKRDLYRIEKKKKSISIIIPTLNNLSLLETNIPILIYNLPNDYEHEIIVVVNGTKDNTEEFLKVEFPQIKIIHFDAPIGFSKACNAGAKEAKNDLLLFLNSDIKVTKNFLLKLVEHFTRDDLFGVSPKILRPNQNMLNESIITGSFSGGIISAEFNKIKDSEKIKTPVEIFGLCGAAMLIEREKFKEIGGFDEAFTPCYYEETDLSYRALKRGWKIIYEPNSIVFHDHDQTITKTLSKSKAMLSYRKNQYLSVWKNITTPTLIIKHILQMVIPKILIPNTIEWKAFLSALIQLPYILKQRKKQKILAKLTDKEIFNKAKTQINDIRKASKNEPRLS